MFRNGNEDRGQSGIGTLIVFIAMILVAALAAGVLMNTASFLEGKTAETGEESSDQVTNRLKIVAARGVQTTTDSTDADPALGGVELIATKASGADNIEVIDLTLQWIDDTGTYQAVHYEQSNGSNADGIFGHVAVDDNDTSLSQGPPVIDHGDDRVQLVIDIGGDDHGGDGSRFASAYDQGGYPTIRETGLGENEMARLRLTTTAGTATTLRITVPESLEGNTAVVL